MTFLVMNCIRFSRFLSIFFVRMWRDPGNEANLVVLKKVMASGFIDTTKRLCTTVFVGETVGLHNIAADNHFKGMQRTRSAFIK